MRSTLVLLLLALLLPSAAVAAVPTIACHCFQDRSFDPARPAAVDPYLLATGRNTLYAVVFGIKKGEVVKTLMGGGSAEELWALQFLAAGSDQTADELSAHRTKGASWASLLRGADPEKLSAAFVAAALRGAATDTLASAAVDAILIRRLAISPESVATLRLSGAGDRETILAILLATRRGEEPLALLQKVRQGRSWGSLLAESGLEAKQIGEEIRRQLR
ncbi:MAG: hypothetical protein C0621_02625 [Desulfuromonas sp.]|nr:MAG: hypothetical protein C0621_02625 [Desulfuromonas sp.]